MTIPRVDVARRRTVGALATARRKRAGVELCPNVIIIGRESHLSWVDRHRLGFDANHSGSMGGTGRQPAKHPTDAPSGRNDLDRL